MMKKFDTDALVEALESVLPENHGFLALHEPRFNGNEWNYLKECIDTGWVSSVGKYVDRIEEDLAKYTGTKYAIAVVNGTAALHICLKLVGVEKDDEVLIPALTFIATANAVKYCDAVPHFCDSEERTLGMDPIKLGTYLEQISEMKNGECYNKQTGRRIKACVPMHTFGHSVDMDPLAEVCNTFNIEIVEDAAESLGTYYKGTHTGNFGKVAAVSFNGNKTITTGGGGAILTNDSELAKLAKHITTTAKVPHKWLFNHDLVGYNYRMPNINAALGCAQIEQLDDFMVSKRKLAENYKVALANIDGIKFVVEPEFSTSNYWLNAIIVENADVDCRDEILETLNARNIMSRPIWTLMNKLPMYSDCPSMDLSIAEKLEKQVINIPSSVILGE